MQNTKKHWNGLKANGLLPDVESSADYNSRLAVNTLDAQDYLESHDLDFLKSAHLIKAHEIMFHDVASWAGKMSKTQMTFGGRTGSPTQRMAHELKLIDTQTDSLWSQCDNEEQKVAVLSFQHARIVACHPFNDGNGRASRLLLDANLINSFGDKAIMEKINGNDYLNSMRSAMNDNNIAPLMKVVTSAGRLKTIDNFFITPDYKVFANQTSEISPLNVELRTSKLGGNSFKEKDITKQERAWFAGLDQKNQLKYQLPKFEIMKLEKALAIISEAQEKAKKGCLKFFSGKKIDTEFQQIKIHVMQPITEKANVNQFMKMTEDMQCNNYQSLISSVQSIKDPSAAINKAIKESL